jgi:hypothetical protein
MGLERRNMKCPRGARLQGRYGQSNVDMFIT